jgi:hypothetical protein
MSDYIKATNFAVKDGYTTGDPRKVVKGTEINEEFNAIATAIGTKADKESPTFTGSPEAPTAAAGTNTTQIATTAFVKQEIEDTVVQTSAIADSAVTTAKLANSSVTLPKLTATGTPSSTTYLRGDNVWSPITAENVQVGIDVTSGFTTTALRPASLNRSTGQVVTAPTTNTLGTAYAQSNTDSYTTVSTDGSRAVRAVVTTSSTNNYTITVYGTALSTTGAPTNGTTTQSLTASSWSGSSVNSYHRIIPLTATTFLVMAMGAGSTTTLFEGVYSYESSYRLVASVMTVDSNGNVTQGSAITVASDGNSNPTNWSFNVNKVNATKFAYATLGSTTGDNSGFINISGTTITTVGDAEVYSTGFYGDSEASISVSGVNIYRFKTNKSFIYATYATDNISGSATTVDLTTSFATTDSIYGWYKVSNKKYLAMTYGTAPKLYAFLVSDAGTSVALTGIYTIPASFVRNSAESVLNIKAQKSETELYAHLTNQSNAGTRVVPVLLNSSGLPTQVGVPTNLDLNIDFIAYNTGSTFVNIYANGSAQETLRAVTIGSWTDVPFSYCGIYTTSTSTSPAPVAVQGVIDGFTGLTAGATYYVGSDFLLSTTDALGIKVGTALTSSRLYINPITL